MRYSAMFRQLFIIPFITYPGLVFAQDCVVEKESLKGSYTGDCRNGKANGRGKAVGTDSYEGEFKSGQPEGEGTYIWDNGNRYTGKFIKGLRDGKGTTFYKRINAPDSIVEGFWKKDAYVGKYEKPYVVYFRSKSVTEVQVESKKNSFKQITFFVTNTSGGGTSVDEGEIPKMKVDDIELTKGSYGRTLSNSDHVKKTEMILYDVVFPIRMKLTIGSEQVEIEFNEEASYSVNVRINQ